MSTSRLAPVLAATILAVVLAACSPPTSDGGEIVQEPDARIDEVLAARAALAEPVPTLTAEAERLVAALEQLWVEPVPSNRRAAVVASLRVAPFDDAIAGLAAVELEGDGPDVRNVRAAVAAVLDDGEALGAAVAAEQDELVELVAFDEQLRSLFEPWDAPGQYSAQLAAFEQLTVDARALADEAAKRTSTPACTEVWDRRVAAATTVAERTDELRTLIRDRRGQEFDELRDEYRQDPFGLGALLGELDAAAAAACWTEDSRVTSLLAALLASRDELAAALDPDDL